MYLFMARSYSKERRQPPAPSPPECRRDGSLMVGVTDPAIKEEGKSEVSEAEAASRNQQSKIDQLEAQLQEAEDIMKDIMKDLREELAEAQAELERVKRDNSQCSRQRETAIYSYQNSQDGKSEMSGGKRNSDAIYYLRRCKKQKRLLAKNIDCLPDDLLSKILANLPAEDIYKGARLVKHNWYRMVHSSAFIHAHLQNSPLGLLFERNDGICTSVAIRPGGRIKIYKFPQILLPRLSASCNGLILQQNLHNNNHLFITNPITRQEFDVMHPPEKSKASFIPSLGYLPSTMEYKVFIWYRYGEKPLKCYICTLGVDKSWREVCTQHISTASLFLHHPVLTQGFMHWWSDTLIWTLNLETEVMTQTPVPRDVNERLCLLEVKRAPARVPVRTKYYLSTPQKSLSVLVWSNQLCWDMWEMRSETGEWTKVGHIDLEAQSCRLYQLRIPDPDEHNSYEQVGDPMVLIPAGWLEYREVLVFLFAIPTRVCILYNVRTQEIDSFELDYATAAYYAHHHTNSLEWFAPCV